MEYLNYIILIEKITDDDILPKGFMSEWCGPPESIPKGWQQVDLQELIDRLMEGPSGS